MTPHSCGQSKPISQTYPQAIARLWFYILSLDKVNDTQKVILYTVADCYHNRSPCQPALKTWARWFGRSRSKVVRSLNDLTRRGWLHVEWRGGRKANLYQPGWRLKQIIHRAQVKGGK